MKYPVESKIPARNRQRRISLAFVMSKKLKRETLINISADTNNGRFLKRFTLSSSFEVVP